MLSKNNKILVGCLALLLAMSVGYALFSDTITINGSATAKGEFELTTTCDMDMSDALSAGGGYDTENGLVTDAAITCNDNIVNASATLGYPGSEKWFRIKVTNTGTIPAKLKQVVELNDPETYTFSKENPISQIERGVTNADKTNTAYVSLTSNLSFFDDYEVDETVYGISDIFWYEEQFDAVLDPNETAYFYVRMIWESNSTTPGEALTPTLNAEITWEQVTE